MGRVVQKSAWNAFFLYLGIGIGYVNTVLLFPIIFEKDEFGLTRVVIALATMISQVILLGAPRTIVRYFPLFFRRKRDRGLLPLALLLPIPILVLTYLGLLFLRYPLLQHYQEQSSLLLDFFYLVFPTVTLLVYQAILDAYLQARGKTVFTSFVTNVWIRVYWTTLILSYYFKLLDLEQFLVLFFGGYLVNVLVMGVQVAVQEGVSLRIERVMLRRRLRVGMMKYGAFNTLSGISGMLTNNIDLVMVTFLLSDGLSQAGVYAIAVYLGRIVLAPAQALARVVWPMVAQAWKEKDLELIRKLYHKSAQNQILLGGCIFILIWVNIDNLYDLFLPEYREGKLVVLFIGLSKLFDMATGINQHILIVSRYYVWDPIISAVLIVLTIALNLILIPIYGIVGAALATAITILVHNTAKTILVWIKLRMIQVSRQTFQACIALVFIFAMGAFLPALSNLYLDSILRSAVVVVAFLAIVVGFRLSEEVETVVARQLSKLGIRL